MSKYKFTKITDDPIYSGEFQEVVPFETSNSESSVHTSKHEFPNLTENELDVLRDIVYKEGVSYKDLTINDDPDVIKALKAKIITLDNGTQRVVRMFHDTNPPYYFYEDDLLELEKYGSGSDMSKGRYKNGIIMARGMDRVTSITNYLVSSKSQSKNPEKNKHYVEDDVIKKLKEVYERKHGGPTHFVKQKILNRLAKKENETNTAVVFKQTDLENLLQTIPGALNYIKSNGKADKDIYVPISEFMLPKGRKIEGNIKDVFKSYSNLLFLLSDLYQGKKLKGDYSSDQKQTQKDVIGIIEEFDKQKKLHPALKYILSLCKKRLG